MELKDALKIGITHIFDRYMVKYVELLRGLWLEKRIFLMIQSFVMERLALLRKKGRSREPDSMRK